jgi:hypothetical protein
MSPLRLSMIGMVVLLGALSSFSCTMRDVRKPPNEGPKVSVFQQPCGAFCQHLRTLGCQEGQNLPDGTSCETFCISTQEAGHDLHIPCILKTQSCGELQKCNR